MVARAAGGGMSPAARETVAGRLCIVLEALACASGPVSFQDLLESTGIDRRTLFRYLAALQSVGLIERGPRGSSLGDRLRGPARQSEGAA